MKKTFKQMAALVLSVVMLLTLVACGNQPAADPSNEGAQPQETYDIKFALDEIQNSTQDIYALKFKELVEEKSDGRINLQIFYLGQLGSGASQAELIQNGTVELGFISCGDVGTMVPEGNIFNMPYVFPTDLTKAKEFLREGKVINETIKAAFEEKNLHVIDWLDEGFMAWTTSTHPITSPADMKGLKMRTMASPILTSTYKAYGADPVTIPITELYSALQLNMAEGQVNAPDYIENMKFYEVQKYMSVGYADFYVASLQFNGDYWKSLPEDIQNIFLEAAKETQPYYDAQQKILLDNAYEHLADFGMEINTLDEAAIADFRALAKNAVGAFYEVGGSNAEQLYADFTAESESF